MVNLTEKVKVAILHMIRDWNHCYHQLLLDYGFNWNAESVNCRMEVCSLLRGLPCNT